MSDIEEADLIDVMRVRTRKGEESFRATIHVKEGFMKGALLQTSWPVREPLTDMEQRIQDAFLRKEKRQ